ncbi:TPA: hypothetical protein H2C15_004793 [Salmonella enterica]|nr:hypothetical protein [Salmonella enterica]
MSETIKATVRLKKQEAIALKDAAFTLTKRAINNGIQKVYSESDLVHFGIEKVLKYIDIDENGKLIFNEDKKKTKT